MVASAKATGSGHLVWPKGKTAETVSADFVQALDHALCIISWRENLPEEEMPPYWMWPLDWEIEKWFEKVKRDRKAQYGGGDRDTINEKNADGSYKYERNELFDDFLKD